MILFIKVTQMLSPLQRLYRTKFVLLAVVSTVAGAGLIFLAHRDAATQSTSWLSAWPIAELGLGLFTTGLFGVLFQYVGQRDAEEANLERNRQIIAEDFATKPDGLVKLISAETRDQIILNNLGVQLDDRQLAHEVYADLRDHLIGTERHSNMDISVALAPSAYGPAAGPAAMFVATIRWEYRVVPTNPVLRFACVSDLDEYRDLLQDPSVTAAWYFEPTGPLDAAAKEVPSGAVHA